MTAASRRSRCDEPARHEVAMKLLLTSGGVTNPSIRAALVAQLGKPIEDQAQILGLGRSQAYASRGNLTALLVELVPSDELRAEVTLEVMRLCVVNP